MPISSKDPSGFGRLQASTVAQMLPLNTNKLSHASAEANLEAPYVHSAQFAQSTYLLTICVQKGRKSLTSSSSQMQERMVKLGSLPSSFIARRRAASGKQQKKDRAEDMRFQLAALVLTCVLKCNSVARREQSLMWDAYGFMGSGFRRARLTSLRG